MHKVYENKGKYNILYQIPQIIYSSIITRFIDAIINIELKREKEKKDLQAKYEKLIRTLKIKFISFL